MLKSVKHRAQPRVRLGADLKEDTHHQKSLAIGRRVHEVDLTVQRLAVQSVLRGSVQVELGQVVRGIVKRDSTVAYFSRTKRVRIYNISHDQVHHNVVTSNNVDLQRLGGRSQVVRGTASGEAERVRPALARLG